MKSIFLLLAFTVVCTHYLLAQTLSPAENLLVNNKAVSTGHIGITVYDPATKTYLYNYNGDKNFIPASNMKLFTLYAGLKHLGDSVLAAGIIDTDTALYFLPAADPGFLLPEFAFQPLLDTLVRTNKPIYYINNTWADTPFGEGWMWDDYNGPYQPERSALPIYGNLITIDYYGTKKQTITPAYFKDSLQPSSVKNVLDEIQRSEYKNLLFVNDDATAAKTYSIPFITYNGNTNLAVLQQVIGKEIKSINSNFLKASVQPIMGIPTDTLFMLMMHRSDNFFAEQTLLMVSNALSGKMQSKAAINQVLSEDLNGIPQLPNWVDGSGLSRYNLCTPQSLVFLLDKLQQSFGLEKMKQLLPTGGEGTLENYYQKYAGRLFAKTGTLSNNTSLSGYVITNKNKLLIFSLLANNYSGKGTPVKQAFEAFISTLIENN